jgi:hypothetical protein
MTVFSFVLGALWHQPFLFGKTWSDVNYPGGIKQKINAPLIFGGTAIMHLLAIAALGAVVSDKGSVDGLLTGLLISLFWIMPAMCGTYLFATRSLKLLAIDAGMYILLFSLSGLVLGTW